MRNEDERLASLVIRDGEPVLELLKIGRDRLSDAIEVLQCLAAVASNEDYRRELIQTAGRLVDTIRRHAPRRMNRAAKRPVTIAAGSGRDRAIPKGDQ
jgi:hypothetical protein